MLLGSASPGAPGPGAGRSRGVGGVEPEGFFRPVGCCVAVSGLFYTSTSLQ